MKKLVVYFVLAVLCALPMPAQAGPTMFDLTTAGSQETINGAIFQQWDGVPQGTGVFEPFVRIQHDPPPAAGSEAGYNTDGVIEFETKDDGGHNWTHSLLLSVVPIITIDGIAYREFALDLNQNSGGTGSLLSLDDLKLYLEATPDLTGWPSSFTSPIYDLDAGDDNWIKLDYDLNHGSGSGDMLAYIPDDLFIGSNPYVYLYSQFGLTVPFEANDGFEEWATDPVPIPAPGAILLGSIGVGLVGWLRRRRML